MSLSFAEADARILFYLTYFEDVAVVPINLDMGPAILNSTELEQTLVHQGIIKAVGPFHFAMADFDADFVASQFAAPAYYACNNHEPGYWALAPSESLLPALEVGASTSAVLCLERCLPCPQPDVPLHDVLDFREKNKGQLARLHHQLEVWMARLSAGESIEDLVRLFENDLRFALEDIKEAFRREGLPFGLVGLETSFEVPPDVMKQAAEAAGKIFCMPMMFEILGSLLNIAFKPNKLRRATNSLPANFQYVVTGIAEGVLGSRQTSQTAELDGHRHMLLKDNRGHTFYPEQVRKPGSYQNSVMQSCMNANDIT
jgi:hypothetical protein